MGLRPGQTNNPKGRPKKSLTKISGELRESIIVYLANNFESISSELNKIKNPVQKIKLYIDLMSFALPRLKSTEETGIFGSLTEQELDQIIEELKMKNNEQAIKN